MTVEARLREAMRARVEGIDAPAMPDVSPRPRRVWPAAVAGFAVVVALVVAVWAVADNGADRTHVAASTAYPSRMVAVTTDGRLIVASSTDGHALQTLASGAFAGGGLAVSPDGRTVYYAEIEQAYCPGDPERVPVTRIMAIPIGGGNAQEIATNVRYPAVSPDGRYLAFTGIPNCSDAGQSVLVKDLYAGAASSEPYDGSWGPKVFGATTRRGVAGLSWAPDSRHLLFTWLDAPRGAYSGLLDTRAPFTTYLVTSPRVKTAETTSLCCYLGTKNTLIGTVIAHDRENTWTVDPGSGRLLDHLACCGSVVSSDRTGGAFLTYWTDPRHPGGLYRWTLGDRHRVFLGSLLATAVWAPESAPTESRAAYPSRVVGATSQGHLVVMSSKDGHVLRTLATDAIYEEPYGGIAVAADGRSVFYTRLVRGATCGEGSVETLPVTEIAVVYLAGGGATTVVGNARDPATSPDGRYLAVTEAPNCSDAGSALVLYGIVPGVLTRRFDSVAVPAGTPGTVSSLAWSPDSRHLKYVWNVGSTYPYILDTATATAVDDGQIVHIDDGSDIDGYLGGTGELVGERIPGGSQVGRLEVWAFDPETGARIRKLFDVGAMMVTSDLSGDRILVSGGALYRWSVSEPDPTVVARGIRRDLGGRLNRARHSPEVVPTGGWRRWQESNPPDGDRPSRSF